MIDPVSTSSGPGGSLAEPSPERVAEARREAGDYVESTRAVYVHAIVFAGVLAALFVVDAISGRDWWVQWVLIGWGIGVLAHAAAVHLRFSMFGPAWKERQIERRLSARRPGR